MERPDRGLDAAQQRSWRAASIVFSVALGGGVRAFAGNRIRQSEFAKAVSNSSESGRSGCTQAHARPAVRSRSSMVGKTCLAVVAAGAVAAPWKATGKLSRSARASIVARRATTGSVPDIWKAGPAEIRSGQAQKVLYLLKNNPELFDGAIESELEKLTLEKKKEEEEKQLRAADVKKDQLVLRRRMDEVREAERMRVATELLYLKVCSKFKDMEVPLIPTMKDGGAMRFGAVELKALTEIYSADALELVKEHLYRIAGQQNTPFGPAVIHISLFQAGQVYAISAAFGYYMRRVDARYQLEKLMKGIADDGPTEENLFDEPSDEVKSLKDYISNFGPVEMQELASIASSEAQLCMEQQISALFGDLANLKKKLMEALGEVTSNEDATAKLQEAIQRDEIDSIRLSFDQLKRFILEAVAFGALLNDSEKQIDSLYELTPAQRRPLLDDGDLDAGRMLPE